MIKKGNLFVISGPSGAGKSTILKEILKDENIVFSISATTREKRDCEKDCEDYFFITKAEFEQKIKDNEFLEWAQVHNNFYGTPKKWIDETLKTGKDVLLDIDVQGALNLKKNKIDAIFIFIMPPSIEELEKRIKNRNTENECTLNIRLQNAKKEIEKKDEYDYIVVNDELENAISELRKIIFNKRSEQKC